jgi:diguanylate cyclase (GGDEF)-like protein
MFGDHVLKIVASTLQSAVRGCDTVARYGGEEFIIIAHHPTIDGLPILAEKIREAIEMLNPEFNGVEIPITASLGAVIAGPEGFDIPDLQKRMVLQADQLLYKSKKAGRNQFHIEALQTPTIPPLDLGLPHVEGTNSPV